MKILISDPPIITIYLCEQSTVHIVYRNMNVAIDTKSFFVINRDLQNAMLKVDLGIWPSHYVAICYAIVVLYLSLEEVETFATSMQLAAETLDSLMVPGDGFTSSCAEHLIHSVASVGPLEEIHFNQN